MVSLIVRWREGAFWCLLEYQKYVLTFHTARPIMDPRSGGTSIIPSRRIMLNGGRGLHTARTAHPVVVERQERGGGVSAHGKREMGVVDMKKGGMRKVAVERSGCWRKRSGPWIIRVQTYERLGRKGGDPDAGRCSFARSLLPPGMRGRVREGTWYLPLLGK